MGFICLLISTSARGAVPLTFVRRDKSKQKHSFTGKPKDEAIHRLSFYVALTSAPFSHSSLNISLSLSVNSSISTLCFTDTVLPHLCFKDSFHKTSSLDLTFTKLSQSSATLRCHYSLQSHYPTVVGRCYVLFFGLDGVSLIG